MIDDHVVGLDDFRHQVRSWCEEHVPSDWKSSQHSAPGHEVVAFQRWWFQELRAAGYAPAHWPEEWGGPGLDLPHQVVVHEEFSRASAPHLGAFLISLHHTPATLEVGGTDEQRRRHLPAILDGQLWCQGFSEPNAGSDLASLRTRAVRDGDTYVVNGQKVWSSGAHYSDRCLLLARTDPDVPKRKGISYFLLDLHTDGVEVRPIRQATGQAEFCELFLTDVGIPVADRVGEEGEGWRIAQATLSAERGPAVLDLAEEMRSALVSLIDLAGRVSLPGQSEPALADPAVRERLAGFHSEVEVLRLLCSRTLENLLRRGGAGPESSIMKVYYSELLQRLTEFGAELAGIDAHLDGRKPIFSGWTSGRWLIDHIGSWEWTIAAGTNEIQRTVIGERVLGLPREPQP